MSLPTQQELNKCFSSKQTNGWMNEIFICFYSQIFIKHLHCARFCVRHQRYKDEWGHVESLGCISDYQTFFRLGIFLKKNKSPICKMVQRRAAPNWKELLYGGIGKGKAKVAFVLMGCLRKLYGSPEHIWKYWPWWALRCLYDRDANILRVIHQAHYKREGLWGVKDKEGMVQTPECPPQKMLLLGSLATRSLWRPRLWVRRLLWTLVIYASYSAWICWRIKLLLFIEAEMLGAYFLGLVCLRHRYKPGSRDISKCVLFSSLLSSFLFYSLLSCLPSPPISSFTSSPHLPFLASP